jgi:hypothetical protein
LHGKFIVRDDIPDAYKIGVFATSQTYDIWVRFSNGSSSKARGVLQPDTEGDVRGLAIKLLKVQGEKALDDEKETQDFILVNHPIFFLPDAQGYIDLATFKKIRSEGQTPPKELFDKLQPSLGILKVINEKKVNNPLFIQYWSTTPYKLGSYKIKFFVQPHRPEQPPDTLPDSPNYLREAIVETFSNSEETVKFDFNIQLYVDEQKTPIENSMIEWKDSPQYTVATIEIPKQVFDFAERKQLDASLSFSPWHTLLEHEPLGEINLSRKQIYLEGAQHRRDYFHNRLREPQPYSSILDDPQ